MVWYLIDVCIKKQTLHDHLEIWNFPSCIAEYFSMLEEKFHLTAWPHDILYVFQANCFIKQVILYFWSVPTCIHLIENLAIVFIAHLTLVVQTLDSTMHRINRYPVDKYYENQLCYPLDSDLTSGKR